MPILAQLSDWGGGACFGAVVVVLLFVGGIVRLMYVPQWLAKMAVAPAKPATEREKWREKRRAERIIEQYPELEALPEEQRPRVLRECISESTWSRRGWLSFLLSSLGGGCGAFLAVMIAGLGGGMLWLIVIVAGVGGAFGGALSERVMKPEVRRRINARLGRCCGSCGYDLTGNVSGVCPECGMNVAEKR
jgi:hypothetical protein